VITLEISSTDIRLMEVEGGRVIKWASRSLTMSTLEEDVVLDSQALSDAVKQLMSSSGIKGRNIIAGVSGLYSLSRLMVVPAPLGEAVAQQAVLETARDIMPLTEDELYFSWQTIAPAEGGQQVLVVGMPRDVVDSEVQALRAAGLNPRILDLKAMALIRAVNRGQALILNIEPSSFDTILVVGGVAEGMRTTAWQESELAVEDKEERLTVALELTVGFYNSRHPDSPLDPATPLFITGQMSGDLALMEKLQARVGYPIEPLAPPLEYPAHLPVAQYAVNIGLALKGTAPSKSLEQGDYSLPDMNLLPQAYKPWRPSARQVYLFLAVVAAIALLFPLYQVTSEAMGKTAGLEARYAIINNELGRRQAEIQSRQPLQKAISEYNTIVDMGGGFVDDLDVINSLAEKFSVEVESITHDGGGITFTCQADSYLAFRKYVVALEESGRFTTPVIPPEGYPYTASGPIKLEPKPAE